MPQFRKLSKQEGDNVFRKDEKKGNGDLRRRMRQQYQDYLRELQPGQVMVAEISDDESKVLVRKRLMSAASRLGYQLEFKRIRNPGELPFRRVA